MKYVSLLNDEYQTLVSKINVSSAKINHRLGFYASMDSLRHECTNYDELIHVDTFVQELCAKYQRDTIVCYLKLIVNERIAYVVINRGTRIYTDNTKEIQRLNERLSTVEFRNEHIEHQLNLANNRISDLETLTASLKADNQRLTKELEESHLLIAKLEKRQAEMQTEIDLLKSERNAFEFKFNLSQQELHATRQELHATRQELHATREELKRTLDTLDEIVAEEVAKATVALRATLAATQQELADTQQKLAEAQHELAVGLAEVNKRLDDTFIDITDLDAEVATKEAAVAMKGKVQKAIGLKVLPLHHLFTSTPLTSTAHKIRYKQLREWTTAISSALNKCRPFVDVVVEDAVIHSVSTSIPHTVDASIAPKATAFKGFAFR